MEVKVNQPERRSWVEINLDQLRQNYNVYKNHLPADTKIMAVIKADAYGHGDHHVAKYLYSLGCRLFAVSNIDEAICLRESGLEGEILILGYSSPRFAKELVKFDLTQTLVSEEYANALSKTGYDVKCQFALDTGMNRIGLDCNDIDNVVETIKTYSKNLNLTGFFTHLCVADDSEDSSQKFTSNQISKFRIVANRLRNLKLPYVHCFNSAGGMFYIQNEGKDSPIKGIVRLGITLYGYAPDINNIIPNGIKPVLSWKSVVSMVKTVKTGETIGYGRTFKCDKPMTIATVTTGYADGFNRHLSNRGNLIVNGMKAPIVGRVCMDQTMIDVSSIPNVKMGDIVTIIGSDGEEETTADDMASLLGTISYEVLCNISKRVQRYYKSQGLLYTL